ncbi:component of IIS longevity pathway SMK-1-domain-containing protein [Pseudomassariella vexata]|uniref:Component of IIS longevity pathway SMK-1-domain-containing protein n=1 Tax=Pseudomassariella vexata TaxID=1141098 RepID=A0A1Y2DVH7_9PEZI|nr:component of IIS longevity pathway SMK-1-domain-containing protein [Pseudomassariella vexata]ORY63253.1 component of IIS longevity pathway SMK-1-domain-containing protein [Pseudomassariella vexata]
MAAQPVPHPSTDKKRVKVYELRNNDWFDRGTGFCTAAFHLIEEGQREPRVVVESEDQPDRVLLETKICKEDGFHKQQETLIVWTEPSNGVDMALSFQEADGCTMIWRFINNIQQQFQSVMAPGDDSLSDDLAMDMPNPVSLPAATMGNLDEIESQMRMMSGTANGREALTKYVLSEDYIGRLIPLVGDAEDLESLNELHRLCNIMKIIILLNDTSIIEHAVSDECVIGVVGALEYDPDFPSHKANHRQWLEDSGRYKEVVRIEDSQILKKVHQTYRLQYLKDVVLARILDDNTFSVLNSLIFFNQVDIVQHLQANGNFLSELFDIFKSPGEDLKRKKDAVLFIQQCCAIAKNLQPPARQTLYNNFIAHGLLQVINFGLRHNDVAVRVGATDVLVSMIDHDPQMIRQTIYRQIHEKQPPLTDSLIELLLVEVDLGVKSHISDALKVLLDQGPPMQPEVFAKANGEYAARTQNRMPTADPQQERFLELFYEHSAAKLFKPLLDLKDRVAMDFTVQQASMFTYLIEILCFFIRQHQHRSKFFVLNHDIVKRVGQLLACPEKFLKLVTIRFLRQLIGLNDEFYIKHLSEKRVIGPILDVLMETMPRDNLLSSACLEFFEFIRKEMIKDLIKHTVENYRDKLQSLSYVELFRFLLQRYDQTRGFTVNLDYFLESSDDDVARRRTNVNPRANVHLMEHISIDQAEEEYWNTSDDEDDLQAKIGNRAPLVNGGSPNTKLVDYASDEETDEAVVAGSSTLASSNTGEATPEKTDNQAPKSDGVTSAIPPPERLSEKRRREEDGEDEMSKLIQHKRRNSTSPNSNASSTSGVIKKKKSATSARDAGGGGPKIAISISSSIKAGSGQPGVDSLAADKTTRREV